MRQIVWVACFLCALRLLVPFGVGGTQLVALPADVNLQPSTRAGDSVIRIVRQGPDSGHAVDVSTRSLDSGNTVWVQLDPASAIVSKDQVFAVVIRIVAGSQPVDGAEVHLDFDPVYLQVVDSGGGLVSEIEASTTLDIVLLNSADNEAGQIAFAAGKLIGEIPSGTFALATIRFKAFHGTGTGRTALRFVREKPRQTNVTYRIESVLAGATDGSVTIHEEGSPPENVSLWPSSGGRPAGRRVNFTSTHRDLDGWRDLSQVFLHIGSTTAKRSNCRLRYDVRRNKMYLLDNAGSTWLGGFAPGSRKPIRNRQCTLTCSKSSVVTSGKTVKVTWDLVFRTSFRGQKNSYMQAVDIYSARTSLQKMGTWRVK